MYSADEDITNIRYHKYINYLNTEKTYKNII